MRQNIKKIKEHKSVTTQFKIAYRELVELHIKIWRMKYLLEEKELERDEAKNTVK